MRQYCFEINSAEEMNQALTETKEKLSDLASTEVLVSIYFAPIEQPRLGAYRAQIKAVFPAANILCCVADCHIANCDAHKNNGLAVCFTVFTESRPTGEIYDFFQISPEKAAQKVLAKINALQDIKAVMILALTPSWQTRPFLKALADAPENIPVFGGLAAKGIGEVGGTMMLGEKQIFRGVIIIYFCGENLLVKCCSSFGWRPIGPTMMITRMSDDYTVESLDNVRPMGFYEKYFGIKDTPNFLEDALMFPFYFQRGDGMVARHCTMCLPNGALRFASDVILGENVRFCYGDPDEIIHDAQKVHKDLISFQPEGLFYVSCGGRWQFLKSDVAQEISLNKNMCEAVGFYSFSEFLRQGKDISIQNMTLLTIALREGKPNKTCTIETPVVKAISNRTLLISRMAKFVEAATDDMNRLNKKLTKLAQTDRLTELYNRGETEAQLHESLGLYQFSEIPFSIIMLDLDFFKTINDSYGHPVGDTALKAVAKIIKASIRDTDIGGRWGGDEFFIIVQNSPLAIAKMVANRIHESVAGLNVLPNNHKITLSVGVTDVRAGDDINTILSRVDDMLYQAKEMGRNRVVAG